MLKSILKLQMVNPISVGLGGPFCGLIHALSGYHKLLPYWALCPIWCLIFSPIILLFPVLLPIYVVSILQMVYRKRDVYSYLPESELSDNEPCPRDSKHDDHRFRCTFFESTSSSAHQSTAQDISTFAAGSNERNNKAQSSKYPELENLDDDDKLYRHHVVGFIQQSIKSNLLRWKNLLIFSQLIYWIAVSLISYGIVYFSYIAFKEYHTATLKYRTLQIATPEQIEYADTIVTIFTTGGMMIWATLLFVLAVSFTASIGCFKPAETARKILCKNFLALAVVSCLLCAVGNLTERYFAHYVILAYEDIILGREYFNPAYVFIALRCFIVYVFCMGLSLTMLMSLRLLPLSFKFNGDKDEDNESAQFNANSTPLSEDKKAAAVANIEQALETMQSQVKQQSEHDVDVAKQQKIMMQQGLQEQDKVQQKVQSQMQSQTSLNVEHTEHEDDAELTELKHTRKKD